jgi:hypothetical protein
MTCAKPRLKQCYIVPALHLCPTGTLTAMVFSVMAVRPIQLPIPTIVERVATSCPCPMWLLLRVLMASPPSRLTHAALGELGSTGCMPSILASGHPAHTQHAHLFTKGEACSRTLADSCCARLGSAGCMPSILASCHPAHTQHAHLFTRGEACSRTLADSCCARLGSAGCMPSILASCHPAHTQHAHLFTRGEACSRTLVDFCCARQHSVWMM